MRYVTASHTARSLDATVEEVNDLAADGTLPAERLLNDDGRVEFIFDLGAVQRAVGALVSTGSQDGDQHEPG